MGFRSATIDSSKDHILILGDSVAYGAGSKEDKTIAFLLNQNFPQYQVINMATPGYGIDQYYLILKKFIKKTRPKIIITVLYTGNDIADTSQDSLFGINKPFFNIENEKLKNLTPKISRFSCQNTFTRSKVNSLIPLIKLQKVFCSNQELDLNSTKLVVKNLLKQIYHLGKKQNADSIFILSPNLIGSQWLNCYWEGKPKNCQNLDSGFHQNHRTLKGILEENELPFLDLNNSFLLNKNGSIGELSNLYNRSGDDLHHYSAKGNRLVTKILTELINKYLSHLKPKQSIKLLSPEANNNKKIALNMIKKGEFEKSLELLKVISMQYPEQSELNFLLGLSLKGLNRHTQALEAFQKAIDLNPSNFQIHNLMGLTYLKIENNIKAIEAFKSLLKTMPDFADGHFNLGLAFEKIGKGFQAITHMDLSRNLYLNSKNQLMAGLAQKKINSYSRKYNITPSQKKNNLLTDRLFNLSQIKKFQKALIHYPNDLDRRYQLAQKYLDTGQLELAQSEFETLLKDYPEGALMWNDLGFLLIKSNRLEEAAAKLKKALAINPDFANAHFNLATVMEIFGENEKAINHLKKALAFYRRFHETNFAELSEKALNRISKPDASNLKN